jgi:hypothetical protein
MVLRAFLDAYESGAQAFDRLLDRLAAEEAAVIETRPTPRQWSAEEWARHLVWLDDAALRVECLDLEPSSFPDSFAVLPGQALERHFPLAETRRIALAVRPDIVKGLSELAPDTVEDTVEDSGGASLAAGLVAYFSRAAAARASALLTIGWVKSLRTPT